MRKGSGGSGAGDAAAGMPAAADMSDPPGASGWDQGGGLWRLQSSHVAVHGQSRGKVDWASGIRRTWSVGEEGAQAALAAFVESGAVLRFGGRQRFRADEAATAAISPHLRFGEISSRQVLHAVQAASGDGGGGDDGGSGRCGAFLRRLAWRDLAYWALWRFPSLPSAPFRPWFEHQRWSYDQQALHAWQVRSASSEPARAAYPATPACL